jgi:hypothetical protein
MARKIRVEFEGATYHVMCRGDRRENIFQARGSGKGKGVSPFVLHFRRVEGADGAESTGGV